MIKTKHFLQCIAIFAIFLISFEAKAQWNDNTSMNTKVSNAMYNQSESKICTSSDGTYIITWSDDRNGSLDIYAQRFSKNGKALWANDGVVISNANNSQQTPEIISDGKGGAIITWYDFRLSTETDIYAQRLDSNGATLWTNNGVAICSASDYQYYPKIVADKYGGAIITWYDSRKGNYDTDIYVQKISSIGNVLWTTNGVALCTNNKNQNSPQITSDDFDGAIITWEDDRSGLGYNDIYAQRVDSNGNVKWTNDGVAICNNFNPQSKPKITKDGNNGAVIAWVDARNSMIYDIYAQRVDKDGNTLWNTNGIEVCTANEFQQNLEISKLNDGSFLIAWEDNRDSYQSDIYAQRILLDSTKTWTANGVPIAVAINTQRNIKISNYYAGAIVTWEDSRNSSFDVYAQKIDLKGFGLWAQNGIIVTNAQADQNNPDITSNGNDGAVIVWADQRGINGYSDIYAQEIDAFGKLSNIGSDIQAKFIGVNGKFSSYIEIKWNKGKMFEAQVNKSLIMVKSGMYSNELPQHGANNNTYSSISTNYNANFSNSNINIGSWKAVYYGSANTATITGLEPNTDYWIEIFAATDKGDATTSVFNTNEISINSKFSNPRQVKTLPKASLSGPTRLMYSFLTPNSIYMTWNPDQNVDGYYTDFANDSNFTNYSGMTYYKNFDLGMTTEWEYDGLMPGTKYYNRMRSYAGNSQSPNVLAESDGKLYTLAAEPIASASFTKRTYGANGEVTFHWNGGAVLSANKRYLLTIGNTHNFDNPIDGADYSRFIRQSYDPNFNLIGNHNVVYDGESTSFTVTGLENNTNYYVNLYVYDTGLNGLFDKNYRTFDAPNFIFRNISKEPIQQASNLVVSKLSNNMNSKSGFELKWDHGTPAMNSQIGYIVTAYPGNKPTIYHPEDGKFYYPYSNVDYLNQMLMQGRVVYNGSDSLCDVINFDPAKEYTFVVTAYGWDGMILDSKNYLTTISSNTISRFSLAAEPAPTRDIVASKMISGASKTVTLSWNSMDADKYVVVAKKANGINDVEWINGAISNGSGPAWTVSPSTVFGSSTFSDGNDTFSYIYYGSNKNVMITGLNSSNTYLFYSIPVKSNPINDQSNNYGIAQFCSDIIKAPSYGDFIPMRSTNSVTFTYDKGKGYTKLIAVYNKDNNTFDGPYNNTSYPNPDQLLKSSNTLGGNVSFALDMHELKMNGKAGYDYFSNKEYVVIDNLISDQIYNIRLYGYNGGNGNEIYTADDGNFASQNHTTLAMQPTNQAWELKASDVSDVSAVLNWNAGSGTQSIVFAGESATSVNQFPQDGSSYHADIDYKSYLSNMIAGAKVVYRGTGTSATITNLPSNTEMFFAVFTYNGKTWNYNNSGKGSENYDETLYDLNIFKSNRISAKTLAPKPAMATALNFSLAERGESQMRIAWTDNTSGLSKYLVLANSSNTFGLPKDGVSYSAGNASYSSAPYFIDYAGKIVYNGNNIDNILIENLPTSVDGTPIYYRVYSYLGDPGSERYSNPASAKMITLSNDPNTNIPSTISATKGNNGQVSFNWTNGNVNDKNILFYRAGGTPTGPVNGVYNPDGSNIDLNTKVLANDLATGTTSRTMSGNFTPGVSYTLKLAAFKGMRYAEGDPYTSPNDSIYSVGSNRFNSVSFPTTVTFVPLTAEPTTTSVVTTFNPTINSLDVSWTQASGANRYLVVVKQSSSATLSPLDGSSWINNSINKYSQNYTYDYGTYSSNAFTGSTEVASVVYNGSGTGTTILGLNTNATYYITVYPFNQTGVGIESENYGAGTTVNRSTLVAKPSTASSLNISNVRSSTAVLNYSHSAENVLILGAKSSTQTDLPTSGSTYSVGDLIGNSKVYYIGNLSSSTISGLSSNTQYTFRVFAFNGSGGKENYASGSNTSTTTTGAPSIPTSLEITSGTVSPLTYTTGTSYSLIVKIKDQDGFYVGAVAGQGTIAVAIGGISTTLTTMATVVGTDTYSLSSFDFSTYNSGNGGVGLTLSVSCGTLTNATQTGITLLASAPTVSPTLASLKSGSTLQLTITLNGTGSNANAGFAAITKQTNISGAFPNAGDFNTKLVVDGNLPSTISASHIFNQLDLIYIGSTLSLNITSCTAGKYYKTSIIPYKGATTAPGSLNYTTGNLVSSSKFMKLNQSEGNLDPDYSEDGTGFDMSTILTNPIIDKIEFDLYNYADGIYNVQITNLKGDVVATGYNNVFFGKGTQRISIPFGSNVAAGSYFITVSNGTDIQMGSFIVMP